MKADKFIVELRSLYVDETQRVISEERAIARQEKSAKAIRRLENIAITEDINDR